MLNNKAWLYQNMKTMQSGVYMSKNIIKAPPTGVLIIDLTTMLSG